MKNLVGQFENGGRVLSELSQSSQNICPRLLAIENLLILLLVLNRNRCQQPLHLGFIDCHVDLVLLVQLASSSSDVGAAEVIVTVCH